MKRKKLLLCFAAIALFAALIFLLTAAERASEEANIRTVPLALWYSITTLTTVGYGDLYPVTAVGRIIGAVLELLSLGALAFLIGALITLLRGKLIPLARIRRSARKEWFVFPVMTDEAASLARALYAEDRSRVILFCASEDNAHADMDLPPYIPSPIGPVGLTKRKKDGRISVFCMYPDFRENDRLAEALKAERCIVYCMTEHEPEDIPEHLHCFDPYDCCARLYWRRFPLLRPDETVVIIGDGKYAEAILACALEQNVLSDSMHTVYRAFGNFENFRRNHYRLSEFVSLDKPDACRDSLFLTDRAWNAQPDLLLCASRIILCSDDPDQTIERLNELQRYFPIACPVHVKYAQPLDGVCTFGCSEEIFTPELVMRRELNKTAVLLNEIYNRSAGGRAKDWNALGSFKRRSNIASAEHLRIKVRILLGEDALRGDEPLTGELCKKAYAAYASADEAQLDRFRRIEHARWMRFHYMNNWSYAKVRNDAARQHPLLVPYDSLCPADQQKDSYSWELMKQLSE
ncbi:MAG: hypothetical protein IKZ44_00685 [Clostridia bacterium]|nr:hypothetical protein [Clostridia bacterium]